MYVCVVGVMIEFAEFSRVYISAGNFIVVNMNAVINPKQLCYLIIAKYLIYFMS